MSQYSNETDQHYDPKLLSILIHEHVVAKIMIVPNKNKGSNHRQREISGYMMTNVLNGKCIQSRTSTHQVHTKPNDAHFAVQSPNRTF